MSPKYQGFFPWLSVLLLIPVWLWWVEPGIAGFSYDDGLYLLGARSLVERQAYLLGATPIVKYPPLFSAWLGVFWAVFPQFPSNILVFKLINVLLASGACGIIALWARQEEKFSVWSTVALLALVGLNPFWIREVIGVKPEPLYVLLSFLTLWWAGAERKTRQIQGIIPLILLSAAVFYLRTIGISLIAGIFFWLWLQKDVRSALLYLIGVGICCLPWLFWLHGAEIIPIQTPHSYVFPYNISYFEEWLIGFANAQSKWGFVLTGFVGTIRALVYTTMPWLNMITELPGLQIVSNKFPRLSFLVGAVLMGLVCFLLKKERKTQVVSLPVLYLFCYILIVSLWSGQSLANYCRFLVMVLPCLYWIILQFFQSINGVKPYAQRVAIGLAIPILFGNLCLVGERFAGSPLPLGQNSVLWQDYQAVFLAVNGLTTPQDRLLTEYPMVYSLYTHLKYDQGNFYRRKGVTVSDAALDRLYAEDLLAAGIHYVLLEPTFSRQRLVKPLQASLSGNDVLARRIQDNPDQYKLIYQSPHAYIRLYRVGG